MNKAAKIMRRDNAPVIILLLFLALTALGGGSSRADVPSLLFLRPAAVLCLAGFLLSAAHFDFKPLRIPLALLALFAAVIALQLVPLPPALWQALPGHQRFAQSAVLAGTTQPWRPISLQPDLTISSLLALLSPLVVLVGFAAIPKRQRPILVGSLVVVLVASTLWGILQMTSMGAGTKLYRFSNIGQPLGLLANRNHQAALLASGFPILRLWVLSGSRVGTTEASKQPVTYGRLLSALAAAIIMLIVLMLTGSRMGLLLGVVGLAGSLVVAPIRLPFDHVRHRLFVRSIAVIVTIMFVVLMIVLGRALALERLFASDFEIEQRVAFAPITLAVALAFLPFGSGFGTFDSVFRIYEPDSALKPTYFNHAHNDFVELVIVGGLPAAILLVVFTLWLLRRLLPLSHKPDRRTRADRYFARTGMIVIAILALASATDYPLRTPLLASIFALMICWVAADRSTSGGLNARATGGGELYDRERVD